MYRLEPTDFVKNRFLSLWSLLAFQAGFINSIGFLACQRFVSHVTGFGSQVGVNIAHGEYLLAVEMFSAPASFILGAALNGYLTVARSSRGLRPRYDVVTLFIPLILFTLLVMGELGMFGVFGEPLVLTRDFVFLSGLSFVCGMQNACFATLTKGQIRTTHLTGISTDLGTDLATVYFGGLSAEEKRMAQRRNLMRALVFGSFSVGAVISASVDERLEYWALAIPCVSAAFVWGVFLSMKNELDQLYPQTQRAA